MPKRPHRNWTREEHILAFNLYCQIPFGTIHMGNPRIIELAGLIGRTIGSVSLKLSNFARFDPALQARGIRGHSHGAKGEVEVWREFIDHPESLAFESEQLRADRLGRPVEEVAEIDERDLPQAGIEREALVRIRVNQSFFRRRIVSEYEARCCVGTRDYPAAHANSGKSTSVFPSSSRSSSYRSSKAGSSGAGASANARNTASLIL